MNVMERRQVQIVAFFFCVCCVPFRQFIRFHVAVNGSRRVRRPMGSRRNHRYDLVRMSRCGRNARNSTEKRNRGDEELHRLGSSAIKAPVSVMNGSDLFASVLLV